VQLAIGRLQLQEQRVNTLVRRADGLQETILSKQRELTETQDRRGALEQQLERNTVPADVRPQLEFELNRVKKDGARMAADIQRLQAEQSDVAAQVASEQARWVDINQRLEELERTLERK
jgi:chromosome segregation ATPase